MGKTRREKMDKPTNSKSKYIIAIVIGVVIVGVAATGISLNNKENTALTTTAPESISVQGLKEGNIAPDFSLTDPQKGVVSKQTFGGKPLFIFFTTTWCTPCQLGAQNLAKYDDEKGGDAFNVLIVFVDDKETNQQFVSWKNKFGNDDWYVAKGIEMAQAYQVKYLDTKYVFDKDGIIKWVDVRPLAYSTIEPVLGSLLEA